MSRAAPIPRPFFRRRRARAARRVAWRVAGACVLLAGRARSVRAQTPGDLAAWDALVVSPVGALPPRAHDGLFADGPRTELTVRYGRWRYDIDDAIHNDFGVTVARQLGVAHTEVALTAGYLSLSCGTCSAWASGGIEVQTRLLRRTIAGDTLHEVAASVGLRASAGGGRYLGEGHAAASSMASATSVTLAFPFAWSSRLSVSVLPGVGVGRFSSVDQDAYGTLPTLGASLAWALPSGIVMDLGMQRVFIDGGPTQAGAALTWVRR